MEDVPRSRDAKHPVLRQLITPFYRTRMNKARRRTARLGENVEAIKRGRQTARDVKALKKAGVLK